MAKRAIPFQSFFSEQAPLVARFLAGMLPAHEVDECVQETFIAALRAYDRFDGENPRAWILVISRRKAIDFHRARARRPGPTDQLAERLPAAAAEEEPLGGEIWAEVSELPEKQRAALVLRYAFDLRHREIGVVLGCSEEAARRSAHEGITKLRQSRIGEAA